MDHRADTRKMALFASSWLAQGIGLRNWTAIGLVRWNRAAGSTLNLHGVYVVCENPIVFFGPEGVARRQVSQLGDGKREVHYLSFIMWTHRNWSSVIKERFRTWRDQGVVTHHVCNEPTEYNRFRAVGL